MASISAPTDIPSLFLQWELPRAAYRSRPAWRRLKRRQLYKGQFRCFFLPPMCLGKQRQNVSDLGGIGKEQQWLQPPIASIDSGFKGKLFSDKPIWSIYDPTLGLWNIGWMAMIVVTSWQLGYTESTSELNCCENMSRVIRLYNCMYHCAWII